jgi:hypothetical protein
MRGGASSPVRDRQARGRRFSFSELFLFKPAVLLRRQSEQDLIGGASLQRYAHANFFAKIRKLQP